MAKSESFLKFGKDSEVLYETLNNRAFGGKLSNIQLFMLAVSFGFYANRRVQDFQRSSTGPRTSIRDEHLAFLTFIHQSAGQADVDILQYEDRDKLAEEYAEGGIRLFGEKLADPNIDSFVNWLIIEMHEAVSSKHTPGF